MTTNPEQDRASESQPTGAGADQQGSVPATQQQQAAGDHQPTTPLPEPAQPVAQSPVGASPAQPVAPQQQPDQGVSAPWQPQPPQQQVAPQQHVGLTPPAGQPRPQPQPQLSVPAAATPTASMSEQATTPIPEAQVHAHAGHDAHGGYAATAGGTGGGAGFGAAATATAAHHEPGSGGQAQTHPRSRTGALLAGLAIGALLGGAVGGGVAAIVASNASNHAITQQGSNGGSITLKNAENATDVSGVAAVALRSVVTIEVASSSADGSGSGVILSDDGYIVTNAHVVTLDGAVTTGQTLRVKLSDGRILDAKIVGLDPYADLAVIKVDATNLTPIKFADSTKLDIGDLTVAIGAPLNLANTVTSGIVSATNRGISVSSPLIPQDGSQRQQDGGSSGENPWDFRYGLPNGQQQQQQAAGTATLPVIQTDASINPGNSGGALLNGHGELIGINVAIASAASSNGTAGSDGLGFAIPSDLVKRVADDLKAGKQPSHGLMGASVADSSQDTDADANQAGGLLVNVQKGGAADKAGLRQGDVVTAIDGVPAVDGTSVSALVRMHAGGSTVTVSYTRNGKPGEVKATLGALEWKSSN